MSFSIDIKEKYVSTHFIGDVISIFKTMLRKNTDDVYIGDKLFKTYSVIMKDDEMIVHLDPAYAYCIDQYKNFGLDIYGKKYKVTRI